MYATCNDSFYTKANMRKICERIIDEYKSEYYENRNSNFRDFEDFADWYINKIINDDIIEKYEDFTGLVCSIKYEEDNVLDNVLNYVCDNVDGERIEANIDRDACANSRYEYDREAFF